MFIKFALYEFRTTFRTYLPVYIAVPASAAMMMVSHYILRNNALWGLSVTFVIISMVAASFAVPILSGIRFYRSMYGDEGYFTFSLPLSPGALMHAKALVTLLWATFGALCSWLIFWLFFQIGIDRSTFIYDLLRWAMEYDMLPSFVLLTAQLILMAMTFVTQIYACTAIAQSSNTSNRLLMGVGVYIVFTMFSNTVTPFVSGLLVSNASTLSLFAGVGNFVDQFLGHAVVIKFAEAFIYYAIAWYCVHKKYNLQ